MVHVHLTSNPAQLFARIALICCFLLTTLAISSPRVDAQFSLDAQNAMDMAYYLSYLESISDFNTEYDFIHPDARAIIPRAAVVGWFLDNYAPRQPQPATILEVEFVSWTWEVTGVTYPYTAQVSFSQAFNDGVETDVVRLVQDQNGIWRWFFGRDRAFVDQVIATYTPVVPTTAYTGSPLIDSAVSDVAEYWSSFFQAEPAQYDDPRVLQFDQATRTGCGDIDPLVHGPLYCGLDETVYLNVFMLDYIGLTYDPLVVPIVIAHEFAHHVQFELGLMTGPILEQELQADCFAGAWARDYATRFTIDESDILAAMNLMLDIGGDLDHGPGTQRVKEFLVGFYDGSQACF
jgi:uncharacterized protein